MCNARAKRFVQPEVGISLRALAIAAFVAGSTASANAQPQHCTHDSFAIDGIAVDATFCIPARTATPSLAVDERFVAHAHSLSRTLTFPVVAGAQTSRTIDDADLAPLGIHRSLHMTLAYRDGTVVLEHALALPGAVPVK